MNKEYNILEILLLKKKKYIVLFSGLKVKIPDLECSIVEKIVKELYNDFNAIFLYYLDFNYLDLNFNDNLNIINERVKNLLDEKKEQVLFIIVQSFPTDKLKFHVDFHIHISLSQNLLKKLDSKPDLYEIYQKEIQKNRVNKYINIKNDYKLDEIINNIFNFIIDDIEKKVYGDQYDKLNHNVFKESKESKESSKLVFNPNAISSEEKRENEKKLIEKEIQEQIDEDEINISDEDEEDMEDVIKDEIRLFGSGSI
jgi:hypothetical protein